MIQNISLKQLLDAKKEILNCWHILVEDFGYENNRKILYNPFIQLYRVSVNRAVILQTEDVEATLRSYNSWGEDNIAEPL